MTSDPDLIREALLAGVADMLGEPAYEDARAALAALRERAERDHRLLGLLYADYCVRTKPGGEDRGEWFTEVVHALFPAAALSPSGGTDAP